MAYQMRYEEQHGIRVPSVKKKSFSIKRLILICVITACVIALMIPSVRDYLIPGDAQVTKAAAGHMVKQIQKGEGVVEAFAEFCQQIIQNS